MRAKVHSLFAPRTRFFARRGWAAAAALLIALSPLHGCTEGLGDTGLTQKTYLELVDWHIAGLWVINCPVAWFRVANYNNVPIKEVTLQYDTYDWDGRHLDTGRHTIPDSSVPPGQVKNFIEQYLGLVDLHSERLTVKLISVEKGD